MSASPITLGPHRDFVIVTSGVVTNVPPSASLSSTRLGQVHHIHRARGFLRFVQSKHYPDQVVTARRGSPLQETDRKIVEARE